MAKTKISEYSTTNSSNTDINSINIDEGCAPSGINNAIREVMVHLKNWQTNASGDGATFASLVVQGTGSFTGAVTMSAGATLSGTNTLSGSTVMAASLGTSASPSIYFTSDTNTGIFSPAADNVAVATGGSERMRVDSSGNVGIGTSSPGSFYSGGRQLVVGSGSGNQGITIYSGTTSNTGLYFAKGTAGNDPFQGQLFYNMTSDYMVFCTAAAERARITSGGIFGVGITPTGSLNDGEGFQCSPSNGVIISRAGDPPLVVNRNTNDGTVVTIRQSKIEQGTISVSGSTVSYNSFAGGHWTQLQQGRGYNPEIPRGTVMSSIGEMAEWKSVVWDEVIEHPAIAAVEAVEGKEVVLDEEGNVIEPAIEAVAAVEGKDAWTETIPHREAYLGNLPVGATFTEDGVTKTVVDDGNERLPKVKISDVVGDKAVYGVFQTYDEVQDMLVTALGAFVVRIAAGVTVQIGDLLESNGDGCAKVQDDDVIRSKTIGKVTSVTPSTTYADGSYTVPAVLYCG